MILVATLWSLVVTLVLCNPKVSQSTIKEQGKIFSHGSFGFFIGDENLYLLQNGNWDKILAGIQELVPSDSNSRLYAIATDKIWWSHSKDSIKFKELQLPSGLSNYELDFHPKHEEFLILTANDKDCKGKAPCKSALLTKNSKSWSKLAENIKKCIWVYDEHFFPQGREESAYCLMENGEFYVIGRQKELIQSNVADFYVVESVLVFIVKNDSETLLYTSTNGIHVTQAQFPPDTSVKKDRYTILESQSSGIFVDVAQSDQVGDLYLSSSDSTRYSKVFSNSNRDQNGHVDFEQVAFSRSTIFINQVIDSNGNKKEEIATFYTNDNLKFSRLAAPKDSSCSGDCYLNLDLSSSSPPFSHLSYPGTLIAHGHIGKSLSYSTDVDVFISQDGGGTFKKILKGKRKWAFGDVIIFADGNSVQYFENEELKTLNLSTGFIISDLLYLGNSQAVLQGYDSKVGLDQTALVTLDFNLPTCTSSDFEKWTDVCYLGEKITYDRKVKLCTGDSRSAKTELCECAQSDYECDTDFWYENGECVLLSPDLKQPSKCNGQYLGRSGYSKKKITKCEGGLDIPNMTSRRCNSLKAGEITKSTFNFSAPLLDYVYLEKSNTIILITKNQETYRSQNSGSTWEKLSEIKEAMSLQKSYEVVFVGTETGSWYSRDQGKSFQELKLPELTTGSLVMHMDGKQLLWSAFCKKSFCDQHFSNDFGKSWKTIQSASSCLFSKSAKFQQDRIYCILHKEGKKELAWSQSATDWSPLFPDIVGFAVVEEFFVVIANEKDNVALHTSLDGKNFVPSSLPSDVSVANGYTILSSPTNSLFLSLSSGSHGVVVQSNSNGTFFHKSLAEVHVNTEGYVDFERMKALESILLTNIIAEGKAKTRISYDNGISWNPLNHSSEQLHLHAFTTRHDPRDSYSIPTALGVFLGVGNTGEYLNAFTRSETYITSTYGREWKRISKEANMFEISQFANVIVLVNDEEPTTFAEYTIDYGNEVKKLDLGMRMRVTNIVSTGSTSFILFGRDTEKKSDVSVFLDFSPLFGRECSKDDMVPMTTDCMFGEKITYHTRKNTDCEIKQLWKEEAVCTCTEKDYECEFGQDKNGVCLLAPSGACSSGYKKLPRSKCSGGAQLEARCGRGVFGFLWDVIKFCFMCVFGVGAVLWLWERRGWLFSKCEGLIGERSIRLPTVSGQSGTAFDSVVDTVKNVASFFYVKMMDLIQIMRRRSDVGYVRVGREGDMIYDFDDHDLLDLEDEES